MAVEHNPFFNMGPIEDPRYFVNRDRELRKLLQYVNNRMSCSIVGSRKIGKTSLVKQAIRLAASSDSASMDLKKCVWVYLNFGQMLSATKLGFWKQLLKSLTAALTESPKECRESIATDWEHLFQSEAIVVPEIDAHLTKLASRGVKPIIVLDEFEGAVRNPNLDFSFYGELRTLVPKLTYITVTQGYLHCLEYARDSVKISPFFNVFVILPVGLFSTASARELLNLSAFGGVPFSSEDVEFLVNVAGCHPFFLQRAGYQLFEVYSGDGPHPSREEAYSVVRSEFQLQARPHFEHVWSKLSQDQKSLLRKTVDVRSLARDSLSPSEKVVLHELEDRALVFTTDRENYGVFSRAFDEFVKKGSFPLSH